MNLYKGSSLNISKSKNNNLHLAICFTFWLVTMTNVIVILDTRPTQEVQQKMQKGSEMMNEFVFLLVFF